MKAWLKGGLITSIVLLISYLIRFELIISIGSWILVPFTEQSESLQTALISSSDLSSLPTFLGFLVMLVAWFIIGALIGLIVQKVKSRKK